MKNRTKKPKRGGARAGAGRPPANTVRLELRLRPATIAWLKSFGEKSPSQVIDELASLA